MISLYNVLVHGRNENGFLYPNVSMVELLEIREVNKLKHYLSSNLNNALFAIYQNDDNNECIEFKKTFLSKNIQKDYKDVLSLLEDKSSAIFFDYYKNLILMLAAHNLDEENFQNELEKINEKSSKQKNNGVYYTPEDVSSYIIYNSIYQLVLKEIGQKYLPANIETIKNNIKHLINKYSKIRNLIINLKVLDPTCGTGAFLVKVLECKYDLISNLKQSISDDDVCKILNSIHGNDIDPYSTYISKTRLLFKTLHLQSSVNINNIYESLELNFHNLNFITSYSELIDDYQLILGNPPYVEKSKVDYANFVKYGNLYADVIHNSIDLLSDNGVMGYIIPISYVSTSRMASVRKYVEQNTSAQYVLSYADRPDCLFVGVHQKLNILLAQKTLEKDNHKIYTSDYNYWYKSQRANLFSTTEVLDNSFVNENYYPKLANNIEESIFTKVNSDTDTIISKQVSSCEKPLYLNKRAAFWIKSFIEAPYKSNEYAIINYKKEDLHLINCILNSSLYWWYWIKVSDCWHITNKELSNFYVPNISKMQEKKFEKLSIELNKLLEKTKVKIDSKQAMYEYKHRLCKNHIDLIDDELAKIYNLNEEELSYIKNYQLYYRTAGEQRNEK